MYYVAQDVLTLTAIPSYSASRMLRLQAKVPSDYTLTLDQTEVVFVCFFKFICFSLIDWEFHICIYCFDQVYPVPSLFSFSPPLPSQSPTMCIPSLFIKLTTSTYCNQYVQGCKVISWRKGSPSGARSLKKTDCPSLSSHQWPATGSRLNCYFYITLERSVNNLFESRFLPIRWSPQRRKYNFCLPHWVGLKPSA